MKSDTPSALARRISSLEKMRQLGNLRPDFTFGFRAGASRKNQVVEVLQFRKAWPAIIVMLVFAGGFSIPLFTLDFGLGDVDDLFDLTSSLFTLFWALGWSVGVLILVIIVLALLFAQEVLIIEPDRLRLRIEIFRLGVESSNPLSRISNLRYEENSQAPGSTWRKQHLAFDYLGIPVGFGSALSTADATRLRLKINATLTHPIPEQLTPGMKEQLSAQAQPTRSQSGSPPQPEPIQNQAPDAGGSSPKSLWLLIFANLVPLAGVYLLDWRVGDIMLLFWIESAIVGFYNVLKMFRIAGALAVFYTLFFIAHFGAFMAVHLMFLFGLFIDPDGTTSTLSDVVRIFGSLWIAILALFISHGFSYAENFLGRREYNFLTITQQMHKPYSRIIAMHVTLIVGGFLVLALDAPILALTLLILLKMAVDSAAHLREHNAAG